MSGSKASDSSWNNSSEGGTEDEETSTSASEDHEEEEQAARRGVREEKGAQAGSCFSRTPYTELCDIQGAVRDALAGEMQWAFQACRAHERWPQGAHKTVHAALDPDAFRNSDMIYGRANPLVTTCPEPLPNSSLSRQRAAAAQRSQEESPERVWQEGSRSDKDLKWPHAHHEAPPVPQQMTSDRDNRHPGRVHAVNSLADEQWAVPTAGHADYVPVHMYGAPSTELSNALARHIAATAFLPSLVSELEAAEAHTHKGYQRSLDIGNEEFLNAVEHRTQPARSALKRLYWACLPGAVAAATRAGQAAHASQLAPQLGHRAAAGAADMDAAEAGVIEVLLEGELQSKQAQPLSDADDELPAAAPAGDAGDAAVEARHAGVAQAAANAGAVIINNVLSQAKYPAKAAWVRSRHLLCKARFAPANPRRYPLIHAANARSQLLAPGHAPCGDSRPPLPPIAAEDVPHACHGSATRCSAQHAACGPPRLPTHNAHEGSVQATMAAAMPATLRQVQVPWDQNPTSSAAPQQPHTQGGGGGSSHAQGPPQRLLGGGAEGAHPLHSMALRLADAMRASAQGGGQGSAATCSASRPGAAKCTVGDGGLLQEQAPGAAEAASPPAVQEIKAVTRGTMSASAPVIAQPVVRPLPAASVCRLLDNTREFRVVIEFETLLPETHAAPHSATRAAHGGPQEEQAGDAGPPLRWFTAEVPLNEALAQLFLRWPADSGPPTWVARGGRNLSRFFLTRFCAHTPPVSALRRSGASAFTLVAEISGAGAAGGLAGPTAEAEAPGDAASAQQHLHEAVAFLYPCARDAGLVPVTAGGQQLEGMLVAEFWSAPPNFSLACRAEAAVQSMRARRLPQQAVALPAAPLQRSVVWSLLKAEPVKHADFAAASKAYGGKLSMQSLAAQPPVLPFLDEPADVQSACSGVAAPTLQATPASGCAPAAASAAAVALPGVAPSDCSSQHSPQHAWLIAAGYLGRSLAAMLSSPQGSAQDRPVKCAPDEVEGLLKQGVLVMAERYSSLHPRGEKRPAADTQKPNHENKKNWGGDRQSGGVASDSDTDARGERVQQRAQKRSFAMMQQTELMGVPLQDLSEIPRRERRRVCKNAAAVHQVLSDVVQTEEDARLQLEGVPADVTLMFRGAQACGLPAALLQRAAERWKKIMAAQSANNK